MRSHRFAARHLASVAVAVTLATAPDIRAQSALEAPTNLAHGWVGTPGVIQFQLLHRFSLADAPTRKLTNSPTLTLATGLSARLTVGFNYASNSDLISAFPNEWEFFARVAALRQAAGAPVDLILQGGHNVAGASQDGGVLVARRTGPWRVLAHAAVFSHAFDSSAIRVAAGVGAVVQLSKHVALSGDATTLGPRTDTERIAWSAGVQFGVPYTPHSLSLHATNVGARSLEGISRGGATTRVGFEYTIPITLRRYLPPSASLAAPGTHPRFTLARRAASLRARSARPRAPLGRIAVPSNDTIMIELKQFAFGKRLEITRGTTVVWRNSDPVAHAVVADKGLFDSGLIATGASWRYTFDTAGTFTYHCLPHPFMKGTILVR